MSNDKDNIISVWGRISRRELFERLGGVSLALSVAGIGRSIGQTAGVAALKDNSIKKPMNEQPGQAFRPFTPPASDPKRLLVDAPKRPNDKLPSFRQRSASWYDKPSGALGMKIFQYAQSANHPSNSCAQAAVATLLHRYNKLPSGYYMDAVTDRIYQTNPPDNASGTVPASAVKAVSDYGLKCWSGWGPSYGAETMRKTLRQWVSGGYPVMVLLDMRGPTSTTTFFGHWVVIYAYDDDETNGHVYPTNWDYSKWKNSWPVFKQAWSLSGYPSFSYPLILGWA